jgi:hypothetical protein
MENAHIMLMFTHLKRYDKNKWGLDGVVRHRKLDASAKPQWPSQIKQWQAMTITYCRHASNLRLLLGSLHIQMGSRRNYSSSMPNYLSGVPQGSVLVHALLNLHLSCLRYCTIICYCSSAISWRHPSLLRLSVSQPRSGVQRLEQCLLSRYSWFSINGLSWVSFNASKSNSILFSTR